MSRHDPISGRVLCDRGCPYPRDGGECLRRQGVPGASGSFGDYCECDCHAATPKAPAPEFYGQQGVDLDKLSTEQVRYEAYAAEQTIEALSRQKREIEGKIAEQLRIARICDSVLKRR